jgi:hypothetical protein
MSKKIIIVVLAIAVLIFGAALGFYFLRNRQVPEISGTQNTNTTELPPEEQEVKNIEVLFPDIDYDGLLNEKEKEIGTDPEKYDTDSDGLEDGQEVSLRTDPLVKDYNLEGKDTDNDGLSDEFENKIGTDPNNPDTDSDSFKDKAEIDIKTDPRDKESFLQIIPADSFRTLSDSDKDELFDEDEEKIGTAPDKADSDDDDLNDYDEAYKYFTDPNSPDTDGDGYKDGEEVKAGYNPNGPGKL